MIAMVKGWWLAIDHHVAMVKGWWLAIDTFSRRTLSQSFREQWPHIKKSKNPIFNIKMEHLEISINKLNIL